MEKFKVLKPFNMNGVVNLPGGLVELPPLKAKQLTASGHIEEFKAPQIESAMMSPATEKAIMPKAKAHKK